MKKVYFYLLCIFSIMPAATSAQLKALPLHGFYKEKFFQQSGERSIETFFPANESQLDLHQLIRDSSIQYYDFTDWLFKKHWIMISRPEGNLSISPLVDFTYGKETTDPERPALFRNTRGIYVEGQLMKRLAFNFVFAENQSRFMGYESQYFDQRGELYVFGIDNYSLQNAVIPGGGRTKPFKTGAYDYAYSIGSIQYQMTKNIRIEAGNNQHFIGTGYRSLLLSDNSFPAPNVRLHWKISPSWSYQVLIRNQKNLYRKPYTDAVEYPYESKFFGATYMTYKPLKNLSVSLFTAGNQLRGDSLVKHRFEGQMLIPVPLIQNDLLWGKSEVMNGISGLNVDFGMQKMRLYGQLAIDKYNSTYLLAGQVGARFFDIFKVKNLSAQTEVNMVPRYFYAAANPKLSYSHYNLPSAHPKGNNFNEVLVHLNYEYKRAFITSRSVFYKTYGGDDSTQIAANNIFSRSQAGAVFSSGSTFIQEFEVGYRFNRRYNGIISAGWKGRFFEFGDNRMTQQMFFIGLKTALFNQYLDF